MHSHITTDWRRVLPAKPALLVLDFDGVLTDNRVYVHQDGTEIVCCSREDGLGVTLLRKRGFPIMILSTEVNPVVAARAAKLQVPCRSGVADKTQAFAEILTEEQVRAEDVVFVGNDVNDLGCLRAAGCGLVVADAHPRAKAAARGVLSKCGGQGAVREVCDALLEHLGLPGHFNDLDEIPQACRRVFEPAG